MELRGTVGILTGASRGIGEKLAIELAHRGVSLALAARSADEIEALAEKVRSLGVKAVAVPTDVTNVGALRNLVERTEAELGPPDLLVNNAGVDSVEHFDRMDPDRIEAMIATNLIGPELLSRLVCPGMIERGRGHIVNISSTAGKTVPPFMTVYSSTKWGVAAFSWGLRLELAPHGVGVSVVYPHYVTGVGMFARRGTTPPKAVGTVSVDDVVAKTIKAIEENKAEMVVAPGAVKMSDFVAALSIDGFIAMTKRLGAYDFNRREADKHS